MGKSEETRLGEKGRKSDKMADLGGIAPCPGKDMGRVTHWEVGAEGKRAPFSPAESRQTRQP